MNEHYQSGTVRATMVPIRETIRELGAAEIARATGFPITSICRWRDQDRIPGKGPAYEWRLREFEAAAARVRAAKTDGNGAADPTPLTREDVGVGGRAATFPKTAA